MSEATKGAQAAAPRKTNVIHHIGEGTPVTVRVTGTPHGPTRVEVTDPDPRAPPTPVWCELA